MNDRVVASLRSGGARLELMALAWRRSCAERIGRRRAGADRYAATETANAASVS